MSLISGDNTQPERIVRKLLHSLGYRFRLHDRRLPGTPDIVFPGRKKVIFVHGCFWHGHKDCRRAKRPASNRDFWNTKIDATVQRDSRNIQKLVETGWQVHVIWQCELKDMQKTADALIRFLSEKAPRIGGEGLMTQTLLANLRTEYHRSLCRDILGVRPKGAALSNADDSSKTSIDLANGLAELLSLPLCPSPPAGQQAGALFTRHTMDFLNAAFRLLEHIRPGDWEFSSSQSRSGIASFFQYEHLAELKRVLDENVDLKAALGGDYIITPDIMVYRKPFQDDRINKANKGATKIIAKKDSLARYTPLRKENFPDKEYALLHASISCKWTMRSDRAQNTRTEALNLIRNRKGRTPNIVAVTFEPLPARIASIALGTGDIDCTYHGALYELMEAAKNKGHHDALEMLQLLVDGRRLRDISDLPFDLAI